MNSSVVLPSAHPPTTTKASSSPTPPPKHPEYVAFALLPTFFILGLLGMLICHVLKRKGYRCTTETEDAAEAAEAAARLKGQPEGGAGAEPELGGEYNDTISENNDTVGQIVHCIMKNQANSDALKAMIHENSIDSDGPPLTPTSPTSPSQPPFFTPSPAPPAAAGAATKHTCNHLHTIGGPGGHVCSRCNQKKWPLIRNPLPRRPEHRRSHVGEVTVLAVGRFRVTKCEKTPRERRSLLITDTNGSAPTSPMGAEPKSRTTSESQQDQAGSGK